MNLISSSLIVAGILIEVFICCILLGIINHFFQSYLSIRKSPHLLLAIVFSLFFLFLLTAIVSQFSIRYERPQGELILFQRLKLVLLLLGGLSMFLYINRRSQVHGDFGVVILLFVVFAALVTAVVISPISLLTRQGAVLEPDVIVQYLNLGFFPADIVRMIWFAAWAILGTVNFANIFFAPKKSGRVVLHIYSAVSGLLFILAYISIQAYIRQAHPLSFCFSWLFVLFGTIGFALGEGLDPDTAFAPNPLNYLRSRLLFKVGYGFVLLIIVLFGATQILTAALIKTNFSQTLFSNLEANLENITHEIGSPEKLELPRVYKIISQKQLGQSISILVVDQQGRMLTKTPNIRMINQESLAGLTPVDNLQKGESGSGEFLGRDGVLMVGAYRPIEKFSAGIIIQQPARIAYRSINKLETDLLLYVIAGIFVVILIGFVFARMLERPLQQLIQGTQAIGGGDLSYRIDTKSIDELGKLAQAYNMMTGELRETQNRLILSEKMIALGNMAAGMAHEIRNPLVSLRTFTQLLALKWEDPDFRAKFQTIVPREIERINRIAESLLKFGRPWRAEIKEVSIAAVLEEVLLLFEPEMKKKDITLSTKFADVPGFKGDAPQLVQAFTNIVKNAIEAMAEKGGGELHVETEYIMALQLKGRSYSPREMTWGRKIEERPYIIAKITDQGGGVPEDKLRNLFDPFYTSKSYGTGMGLPITLRIIEEHRGAIKVSTNPGVGTTFIVYIPQTAHHPSEDEVE